MKYFARVGVGESRAKPGGIVRRYTKDGQMVDEAFTRNLRWEPTEFFNLHELGHNEDDIVEITVEEAERFIDRIRASLGPT